MRWDSRLVFDRTPRLVSVPLPDRAVFESRYERPGRPALFDDALLGWQPDRFTPAALAAHYPDSLLDGYRVDAGQLVFDDATGLVPTTVRAGELPTEFGLRAPTLRVRHRDFARLPGLLSSAPTPEVCASKARLEPNLWISPAGVRSQLHFDQPHTLLAQLVGDKRVLLFAPGQRAQLHPFPLASANAQFSQADVAAPDLVRFPGLARARGVQCVLRPGQALFIPGGWWHYLDAEDVTVSFGFRWWGLRHLPRLVVADVYKRVRGHIR